MNTEIKTDEERYLDNLEALGVKFAKLDKNRSNSELREEIYQHQLYEINEYMIEEYFDELYFWRKSYTYISKKDHIKEYIDKNIVKYFNIIIDIWRRTKPEKLFNDDEGAALELINNTKVSLELRKEYIRGMITVIGKIESVNERDLWDELLLNRVISETAEVILGYFDDIRHGGYSNNIISQKEDILIDYINKTDDLSVFDFANVNWAIYHDIKKDFYKFIISSARLKDDVEIIIKTAYDLEYELNDIGNIIKPQYIKIMIENNILVISAANCKRILGSDTENLKIFIYKHCDDFCQLLKMKKIRIDNAILEALLRKDNTVNSEDQKVSIVMSSKDNIQYNAQYNYSDRICEAFIDYHSNKIESNSLYAYIEKYDITEDNSLKNKIFNVLRDHGTIRDFKGYLQQHFTVLYDKLIEAGAF